MYSFAQRADTQVLDEPLYGSYLERTGIDHPGRQEIIDSMETDTGKIIEMLLSDRWSKDNLFIKNMSHHLIDLNWEFILGMINIIYIRNPKQIIASFSKVIKSPTVQDVGVKMQLELYEYLDKQNKPAIILNSNDLLKNPKKLLTALCEKIEIDFEDSMLKWQPGPRIEDGVWAKYWYRNVHQSTGFSKQQSSNDPLPVNLIPLYDECLEYYNHLNKLAIKA